MTVRTPVIGIAGSSYVVPRPFGELAVQGATTNYVHHVVAAGGRPVILPMESAPELLDVVNALILAGGGDVDPALYGGVNGHTTDGDRLRDETEIDLARRAQRAGLPLLGVCRGAQVLAVAFGGRLITDLGEARPHVIIDGGHRVLTRAGSSIASLLGERATVNSLHHQAIADVGPRWQPTAWADDGVIEAIEWSDDRMPWPVLGVQWHPELEDPGNHPLFDWLVSAAAAQERATCQCESETSTSVLGGGGT